MHDAATQNGLASRYFAATMTVAKLISLTSQKLRSQAVIALLLVSLALLSCTTMRAAYAGSFQRVIENTIQSGALDAAQSDQFRMLTSTISQLAGLDVSNVVVSDGVVSGDVEFLNLKWHLLAYSGGGAGNTFIAFAPDKIFKFKDILRSVPGIELLDVIRFDQQMLAFAVQDIGLSSDELPVNVRVLVDRFFESSDYELEIAAGLTQFATFNLADAGVLRDAIQFLGGKSAKIQTRAALKGNDVLSSLLSGQPPVPQIELRAALPTFRPSIGGKVTLPADMQLTLTGVLEGRQATLGYIGTTQFKVGEQMVDMNLETGITLRAGAPEFTVTASTFKGEPWHRAFGVNWLTIEDYRITFGQEADSLKMGFGGKTSIGEKQFDVFALAATSAKTIGIPIPEKIQLGVNDGPDKVGSISLRDIASIFVEMLKATGQPVTLPDEFPDIAITGTETGKGPSISVALKTAGDAGVDISGALRVLGSELATVDRAFIQADSGVEIKARTTDLGVGPLRFPTADVDISLTADGINLSDPRVLIKTSGLSLFGSQTGFDLIMRPTQLQLKALADFGSLFKFDFLAGTGEKIESLQHLASVDFQLASALSSDPAQWIRSEGKKAVTAAFGEVRKGLTTAQQELQNAQAEVARLDGEIERMKQQVEREKLDSTAQLRAAENEVGKLNRDIGNLQSQIDQRHSNMRRCNQSTRQCVFGAPVRTGCHERLFGECVIPKMEWRCQNYADVPNLPAIAQCEANNAKQTLEIAGLETAKGTLIASREVAQKTLEGLRKGIEIIPLELDPRVFGLIASRETAMLTLKAAEETVKGVAELTRLLDQGIDVLGRTDVFALEKSAIQGSMRGAIAGKPVVLDMNFRMLGTPYQQRLAFSLTDMGFNARQFEVIALGAAVNTVIKLGHEARIIPHALLDEVQKIYNKKRAEVDAELDRAVAANPVNATQTRLATIGETISDEFRKVSRVRLEEWQKETTAFSKEVARQTEFQLSQINAANQRWQTGQTAVVANTVAPANSGQLIRIVNRWRENHRIHIETGPLVAEPIKDGAWSAMWMFQPVPDTGFVRIVNRWKPDHRIHIEHGTLEASPIHDGAWSAMWTLQPVPDTNYVRIVNRWQPDIRLHVEHAGLEATPIHDGAWSAMWIIEPLDR